MRYFILFIVAFIGYICYKFLGILDSETFVAECMLILTALLANIGTDVERIRKGDK